MNENNLEYKLTSCNKWFAGKYAYTVHVKRELTLKLRQQKTLEEIVNEAQTMASARIEMENKLQEEKMKYKESQEKLIEAEKSNLELQNEISSVNLLINQVSILTHSSKPLLIILNVGVSMGEKNRVQHNSESAHSRKNA